tara:strand:- start:158 stop:475 length:318 start_codon:yes stop_codon:yes gene_type:complete
MAVTKTLTTAIPAEKNSKVEEWELEMIYENDSEGDATYYTSTFNTKLIAANGDFTAKAKGDWTKSQIEALCPTSHWDDVFASQVDSVITNPVVNPVPDKSYSIPS